MTPITSAPTVAARYASYARWQQATPLSSITSHHARRALIDWFAATIAGADAEPVRLLKQTLDDDIGRGTARLIDGQPATPRAAAMVNGTASHVLEFDDIFRDGLYHPGSPIIAAALATAQDCGAGGAALLRAITVGYEISTRISAVINPAHYAHWHTTGTVGTIGAAAACAVLRGCDTAQIMHAMTNATSFGSGLQQAFRSTAMTKPLHVAHAADVGVWTAKAAWCGMTGAADILEGGAGFGAAMADSPDWEAALGGLGQRYNIEQITFKNHGCCGQTFAAVDAVQALHHQHGFAVADISKVTISTYRQALEMTGNFAPADATEARFSMPFAIASMLLFGSLRLEAFSAQRLADASIRRLMQQVEIIVDADIDAAFPRQRGAQCLITLTDGRELVHFQPHRVGDPEEPMTDAGIEEKFLELARPSLGRTGAENLLAALWKVETCDDLGLLMELSGSINHDPHKRT